MRRGASLSSPSETAAKWRSIHLGLFFLLSQISRATKHPPLHGLKDADDMKRIAFMVLIFYLAQNYRKKSIRVKKKVIFLTQLIGFCAKYVYLPPIFPSLGNRIQIVKHHDPFHLLLCLHRLEAALPSSRRLARRGSTYGNRLSPL